MYLISLISLSPTQPDSEPNQLVNALIEAKNRGINVKVILDQNIDFEAESSESAVTSNKNQQAYELLRKNNVPVFFDTSEIYTHAKAIIIDSETVILGSTNWSKAALSRNNEASVLIHSKEFAESLQIELNKIAIQENIPASLTPSVPIPKDFVLKKNLLGEMAVRSDESDLPPKKWTQRRVGDSMNASSKTGGIQCKGKTSKRSGLTGILRSQRSRWSRKAAARLRKWQEVWASTPISFTAGKGSLAIAAIRHFPVKVI